MTEQVQIFDQVEEQVTEPAPQPVHEEPVFADIEEEPQSQSDSVAKQEEVQEVEEQIKALENQIQDIEVEPDVPSEIDQSEECKAVPMEDIPMLPSKEPTYSYEEALAKCIAEAEAANSLKSIAKDRPVRQNMGLGNIPLCPIFEPTLEEFTQISFEDYVKKCED